MRQLKSVGDEEPLPVAASKRAQDEEFVVADLAGTVLRMRVEEIPNIGREWAHIPVRELAGWFSQYLYLPRLRNTDVLKRAIAQGVSAMMWEVETFAYADSVDSDTGRYRGLTAGIDRNVIVNTTGDSVLVHPSAARAQMDADEAERRRREQEGPGINEPTPTGGGPTIGEGTPTGPNGAGGPAPIPPTDSLRNPTRYFGSVERTRRRSPRRPGKSPRRSSTTCRTSTAPRSRSRLRSRSAFPTASPKSAAAWSPRTPPHSASTSPISRRTSRTQERGSRSLISRWSTGSVMKRPIHPEGTRDKIHLAWTKLLPHRHLPQKDVLMTHAWTARLARDEDQPADTPEYRVLCGRIVNGRPSCGGVLGSLTGLTPEAANWAIRFGPGWNQVDDLWQMNQYVEQRYLRHIRSATDSRLDNATRKRAANRIENGDFAKNRRPMRTTRVDPVARDAVGGLAEIRQHAGAASWLPVTAKCPKCNATNRIGESLVEEAERRWRSQHG